MSVHVVVVAESPLAFLPLGNSTIVATAVSRAAASAHRPSVSVWVDPSAVGAWHATPASRHPKCAVELDRSLVEYVRSLPDDIVLIHDAQRPLTLSDTFDRVIAAVSGDVVAVRPAHVVVDTLKIVDENLRITGTVNRDEVQSLTSPEGYLRSALTGEMASDGWTFVAHGNHDFVRGDQESLRVREPADVLLVESFLAWSTSS